MMGKKMTEVESLTKAVQELTAALNKMTERLTLQPWPQTVYHQHQYSHIPVYWHGGGTYTSGGGWSVSGTGGSGGTS